MPLLSVSASEWAIGALTQIRNTHTPTAGESVRTQFELGLELKFEMEMSESKRNGWTASDTHILWVVEGGKINEQVLYVRYICISH